MMQLVVIDQTQGYLKPQDIKDAVEAVNTQVQRDFTKFYDIQAEITEAGKGLNYKEWPIYLLQDATQAGALGYHDTLHVTKPRGFIFCKTTVEDGEKWQVTLSHEALEMLGDPDINVECEAVVPGIGHCILAYETADAVEGDTYNIQVSSGAEVPVSNFVTPAWFLAGQSGIPRGTQYDYLKKLKAPGTMTSGGYFSYAVSIGDWQQKFAQPILSMASKHLQSKLESPFSRASRRAENSFQRKVCSYKSQGE